ncbi:MAG: hypothetical protein SGI89_11900 [bacterium]|nr:hypothetical protein [bacterium]
MKRISALLISLLPLLLISCSSGTTSMSQLQGAWVSRFDDQYYNRNLYYQFEFVKDSFFVEIGVLSDNTTVNYEPYKAKGVYRITKDKIVMTGIAKPEGSTQYRTDYRESFEYIYDENYLTLYSEKNRNLPYYQMIRK